MPEGPSGLPPLVAAGIVADTRAGGNRLIGSNDRGCEDCADFLVALGRACVSCGRTSARPW